MTRHLWQTSPLRAKSLAKLSCYLTGTEVPGELFIIRRHIAKLCAKKSVGYLSDDNFHHNIFGNFGAGSVIEHKPDTQYIANVEWLLHSGAASYP